LIEPRAAGLRQGARVIEDSAATGPEQRRWRAPDRRVAAMSSRRWPMSDTKMIACESLLGAEVD